MQCHECNKHNYLCIIDSLKFLFPYENWGVTNLPPLKMNLVLEIQTDHKRNFETLPSIFLLFPKYLLPWCGDSIAPCTS
jgi:hypothetical protein